MTRPPFPAVVDSTMLSAFRSCPQRFLRIYLQHWKPKAESVHLVAGAAYARGLEVARKAFYDDGASAEDAQAAGLAALIAAYGTFECPADSAKSVERMAGALAFYFEKYPFDGDAAQPLRLATGKHAIEFSFAEPLDFHHPVTGDPIIFTGRSDAIMGYASGAYILDDKTTSSLGASWPRQWEMRGQFTGYTWAARRSGIPVAGCLVRGVSILKTRYDTLQALTYRSDYEIERWHEQTLRDLSRMAEAWSSGWWDYNLGEACNEYGGCGLTQVCKSSDPDRWLDTYFERRVWNPLKREEEALA